MLKSLAFLICLQMQSVQRDACNRTIQAVALETKIHEVTDGVDRYSLLQMKRAERFVLAEEYRKDIGIIMYSVYELRYKGGLTIPMPTFGIADKFTVSTGLDGHCTVSFTWIY